MAKAVFFNLPFYGHMNLTFPLVAELARRGEQITSSSPETFRAAIERVGAACRGIDAFMNERTPVDTNLVKFAYTLIRTAQEILPTLRAEIRAEIRADPPEYVIDDSLCSGGRCVAESVHIPAVASIAPLARPPSPLQREVLAGALSILPSALSMLVEGCHALRAFNVISKQLQRT
jgi:UDP:flavonoid glycosyltransferase YjiC (YdhE family)